jgi:hypothetical protein
VAGLFARPVEPPATKAAKTALAANAVKNEAAKGTAASTGSAQINFDKISNASSVESAARKAGLSRAETLEYLQMVAAFCENVDFVNRGPNPARPIPADVRRANEYNRQFAKRFCDRPDLSSDSISAEMLKMDASGDTLQSQFLEAVPEKDAQSVGVPTADRLFLGAKSPSAMTAAAFYLIDHGGLPQLKRLPVPASVDPTSAQVLALDMIGCKARGGCGPDGFFTAWRCGTACRPGIALGDVWKDQYSPEAIRYAQTLSTAIEADRAAAQSNLH